MAHERFTNCLTQGDCTVRVPISEQIDAFGRCRSERRVGHDAVMLSPKVSIDPLAGKGLTISLELLDKMMSFDLRSYRFWIHRVFRRSNDSR